MKRALRIAAIAAAALLVILVTTVLIAQRVSDGPIGPISGGPLRAGELATGSEIAWSLPPNGEIELQLVDPAGSRITGALLHEGQLYVPCDLGFIWRRVPRPVFRFVLSVIYAFKHWHEDALLDGRVVLRIGGKRYERQAVRVTDPELLATLRAKIEQAADGFFSPPGLTDDAANPEAIWFFRMDPRPAS